MFPPHVTDLELPPTEQRALVRRDEDRKLMRAFWGVAVVAAAAGASWGVTQYRLDQKLDRSDQAAVDARQAALDARQDAQLTAVLDGLKGLKTGVDSANLRLHQMACEGKPVSCR